MGIRTFFRLFFILLPLLIASCQKPLFTDDDHHGGGATWEKIPFQSKRLIQALKVTPSGLFAISEDEFFRLGENNKLLEQRSLSVESGVRGIPALSDLSFVRLTTDEQTRQVVEFHHAYNTVQVVNFLADSLQSPDDTYLEIEFLARTLGAFSSDGTFFLLPAKVFPNRHYAFFLFEIQFTPANDAFVSIELKKRINLEDLSADFGNLANIRFLEGNFYVTSKEGAWRISPTGETLKLFSQWMLDFFSWQGKLYVTGINPFDLHESNDNGLTWKRLNHSSDLGFVEVAGDRIFTHPVLGHPYQTISEDLLKAKEILYPKEVPVQNPSFFYSVGFFADKYYFSVDKTIYFTDEVVVK